MRTKLTGIVLRTVRHNDRTDIVTLYTAQRGLLSLATPAGGATRAGRMRNAMLLPLAIVETDVNIVSGRGLPRMGQLSSPKPWRTLHFDVAKGGVGMFLSEFMIHFLREAEPDARLWHFLTDSLTVLDAERRAPANYTIAFLIRLLDVAGITPDANVAPHGALFDLRTASFTMRIPLHRQYVTSEEAAVIPKLLRMNYSNMHLFRLSRSQRQYVLDRILEFYNLHLGVNISFNSLPILRTLF